MTPRQFFRALGWLVSEAIPAQAVRCAKGRDYDAAVKRADQLNSVEEERDVLEPGELRNRFYCNRCGGGYYTGEHDCLRPTNSAVSAADVPATEHIFLPCGVLAPDWDALLPYKCSLADGHSGNHVAWAGKLPIAEWADGSQFVFEPGLPHPTSSAAAAGADPSHPNPPGCGTDPAGLPPSPAGSPKPSSTTTGSVVGGDGPVSDSAILSAPETGQPDLTHLAECLRDAVGDHYDFAPRWASPHQFPFWHDDGLIDAFDWEGAATAFLADVCDELARRKNPPPLYTPPPDPDTRWDALSRTPH